MAENVNPLILPIGADASQFKRSIQEVKDRIKELGDFINQRPFNLVAPETKSELSNLKRTLRTLQDDVQNTSNAFDKSQSSTKGARTALTSLTLVAQDLPFGFIAIQNNLPALIQSFGELQRTSGGVKGALSQIGSAITGPGGLFLAFSVVTAGVTFLVQKYGSLGNAIDALIGKSISLESIQKKLNKSFDDTVKSTAGEIANLNSLVGILTNANSKKEQQLGAYDELNKKYPGFLFNIDRENIATATSAKLIAERTKLISQQIILEGRRNALIELIGQSAKDGEIALRGIVTQGKDLGFFEKVLLGIRGTFAGIGGAGVLNILSADLGNAAKESQFFKDQLDGVNNVLTETNNSVNILIKSQEELERKRKAALKDTEDSFKFEIEPLAENLSLQQRISQLERLGTILLDTKSKESDRIQALKELSDLEYDVWGGIKLQDLSYQELRATLVGVGKTYQQLILQEEQRRESLRLTEEAIKRQAFLNKEDEKVFLANIKAKRDELTKLRLALPKFITVPVNIPINQENIDKLGELAKLGIQFGQEEKDIEENEKRFVDSVKKLNSAIENGLRKPFRDFFDELLDNGKFTFDSFVDLAKDSFKRILADLAAAGIARILTSILTGGQSDAILAGGSIFDAIFGKKVAAPSFSGVGGGPLQMAGAVNLQLRGSDLVASINRTNTTINRVG